MSDMYGIRPPFQGWESYWGLVPRALPWADMVRPVGAGESRTLAALQPKLLSIEWRVTAADELTEAVT